MPYSLESLQQNVLQTGALEHGDECLSVWRLKFKIKVSQGCPAAGCEGGPARPLPLRALCWQPLAPPGPLPAFLLTCPPCVCLRVLISSFIRSP